MRDAAVARAGVLMLHPPGAAYSVWLFCEPDGAFRGWYVNLEQPRGPLGRRRVAGVDTVDYDLDIVVAPDRRWRWKDEDEFAEHLPSRTYYWVRRRGRRCGPTGRGWSS